MFENKNKIIIVDNNNDHIKLLSNVFKENFIKCEGYVYDFFNKLETPLNNIRIAFFDVNLADVATSNKQSIFNDLANALNEFISKENGPYSLIFWTQNKDLIDEFIEYIKERRPETPKPFNISYIDKDEFLVEAQKDLFETIQTLLKQQPINLLFEFENHVKQVVTNTINELYNIIPNNEWGNNEVFKQNFDSVFSKIAIGSLGYEHAKSNPDKAIYEALMPLISSKSISSMKSVVWKETLLKLSTSTKNSQPNYPENFESSRLNSIFHLDLTGNSDFKSRGIIIKINNNDRFQELVSDSYANWFSALLPGINRIIRNTCIPIAIEISSSCDYSQLKPRLHKYLLGVLLPSASISNLTKEKVPQSLFILDGEYDFENKNYKFCFNLNYSFTAPETDEIFSQPIFSLKKEITDMIGNRYANHVSRIGITSF